MLEVFKVPRIITKEQIIAWFLKEETNTNEIPSEVHKNLSDVLLVSKAGRNFMETMIHHGVNPASLMAGLEIGMMIVNCYFRS